MSAGSGQFAVRVTEAGGERHLETIQNYGPPLTKNSLKILRQRSSRELNIATRRFELRVRGTSFRGASVILRVRLFENMAASEVKHKMEMLIKSIKLKFIGLSPKHRRSNHKHQPTIRRPHTGHIVPVAYRA